MVTASGQIVARSESENDLVADKGDKEEPNSIYLDEYVNKYLNHNVIQPSMDFDSQDSESETDYSINGAWHKPLISLRSQWIAENPKATDNQGRTGWIKKRLEKKRIYKNHLTINNQLRRFEKEKRKVSSGTAINNVWTPAGKKKKIDGFAKTAGTCRQRWAAIKVKLEVAELTEAEKDIMLSKYHELGKNWHQYRLLDSLKNKNCLTIAKTMQAVLILEFSKLKNPVAMDISQQYLDEVCATSEKSEIVPDEWINKLRTAMSVNGTVAKSYVKRQLEQFIKTRIIRLKNQRYFVVYKEKLNMFNRHY